LVSLVTGVAGLSAAFNIVKEKEIGTIEQINVTPIKKWEFILGKLVPFLVMGYVVFTVGLFIAWIIYGIIPLGHIALLYLFLGAFLFAILGLGLVVSTYCDTQQQANSIMFLFMMVFNMMSGLYTPIDSMPGWAQFITHLVPISYFIDVMRMVVIKGSGMHDVLHHLWSVLLIGIVLNTWAVLNYKKTT
jgi:ABC-2 type transport system permease protein